MQSITKYQNGNTTVELFEDGTRIVKTEDQFFKFEYPLNIDIRVSTKCSFGRNPKTGKGFCEFCHESSRTDGVECDYKELMATLEELPKGIELALGCNEFTEDLYEFILWCGTKGYIVNLTVNQGHLNRDFEGLRMITSQGFVRGLGISYRSELKWDVPQYFLDYPNTVFHVIAGIDNFADVLSLKDKGVKKLLILGEKDFGYNKGKVDLKSQSHKEWYWYVSKLFEVFDTVSFDNLGLEQLNIKRFLTADKWEVFNQGENSMYINAVDKYLAPSSRSDETLNWCNISLKEYFQYINEKNVKLGNITINN